jgi:hypothetical protein
MSAGGASKFDGCQIQHTRKHAIILSSSLDTIEVGGGSARCMMAEIFLPKSIIMQGLSMNMPQKVRHYLGHFVLNNFYIS